MDPPGPSPAPSDSSLSPATIATTDLHAAALAKAQSRVAAGEVTSPAPAVRADNSGEDLTDILAEECAALAARDAAVAEYGLDSVPALRASVRVLDSWIGLYKLAPMDKLLDEILPLCRQRYAFPEQNYKRVIAAISHKHIKAKNAKAAANASAASPEENDEASSKDVEDTQHGSDSDDDGAGPNESDTFAAELNIESVGALVTTDPSHPCFGLTSAFIDEVGDDLELVHPEARALARVKALKSYGLPVDTPIDANSDGSAGKEGGKESGKAAVKLPETSASVITQIHECIAAKAICKLLPDSFDCQVPGAVEAALAAADELDSRDAEARRLVGADLYLRALQLQAFLRYKQFRFRDSLALFRRFRALAGPSPELLENMGHAHNAVGEHSEAVQCFSDALAAVKLKGQMTPDYNVEEHMGGLLLGLGVSYKRLGRLDAALGHMQDALSLYRRRFSGADHSLVAKTLSAIADTCEVLDRSVEAMAAREEAVRIFRATCGVSPLTANALDKLGRARVADGDTIGGLKALDEALFLHLGFDTMDLSEVATLLMLLLELRAQLVGTPFPTPQSPALTAVKAFEGYVQPLRDGIKAMEQQGKADTEDAAVVYKTSGEIFLVAGAKEDAKKALLKSLMLLVKVKGVDVSGLVKTVIALIEYCG